MPGQGAVVKYKRVNFTTTWGLNNKYAGYSLHMKIVIDMKNAVGCPRHVKQHS